MMGDGRRYCRGGGRQEERDMSSVMLIITCSFSVDSTFINKCSCFLKAFN